MGAKHQWNWLFDVALASVTVAGEKPRFLHPLGNKQNIDKSFLCLVSDEEGIFLSYQATVSIWWGGGLRLAHCINCSASLLVSRLLQTHHREKDTLPRPNILDTRIVQCKRHKIAYIENRLSLKKYSFFGRRTWSERKINDVLFK